MTHTGNVKIAPNVGKESLDKRCLYIKNVSPTITQEDLSAIFTPFGAINVDLKRREEGGLGVAFVNFDDEIKADVAQRSTNKRILKGYEIQVVFKIMHVNSRSPSPSPAPIYFHSTITPPAHQSFRIIIHGLDRDIKQNDILKELSIYAPENIKIFQDNDAPGKNYAVVKFKTRENAVNAMLNKDGVKIHNSQMNIIMSDQDITYSIQNDSQPAHPLQQFPNQPRIQRRVNNELMRILPQFCFNGTIHLIDNVNLAVKSVDLLLKEDYLGFDTESEIIYRKDALGIVSLIQLANKSEVWLFFIRQIGGISPLLPLFTSDKPLKVCVGVQGDIDQLLNVQYFNPRGFYELCDLTKQLGIDDKGLQRICANLLGIYISKKEQCSNWGQYPLTESQIRYAANDAWVSRWAFEQGNEYKVRLITAPPLLQTELDERQPLYELFVGNLSLQTTISDLYGAFEEKGFRIQKIDIPLPIEGQYPDGQQTEDAKNRGFGFVKMFSMEDANKAVKDMKGVVVCGKQIKVRHAGERR